jgi:hydroxymethylpyrimidine pyrophosphatase-like HAD family hydrolase
MKAFRSYPHKVICSARSIEDLINRLELSNLSVDWIVAHSGALVTDGRGKRLFSTPIEHEPSFLSQPVEIKGYEQLLQLSMPYKQQQIPLGWRQEVYQGIAYYNHWQASKFRAIHRLLRMIDWTGRVQVFGDGPYDSELLTYFDGSYIDANTNIREYKGIHV